MSLEHDLRSLKRGECLVEEGEQPDDCRLIGSGFVYRNKLTCDGKRQIVSIHLAGEIVDLHNSFLNVADHNVQALTDVEVALIPRAAMRRLSVDYPAIARALLIETLIDASILREWLLNVGQRSSRARIAHLICEIALRLRAAGLIEAESYTIPMIQEEIADCLGITQVHVNRTFRALAEDGLIERDGRTINIINWGALTAVGEFNPRYLHLCEADANPGRRPSH